jgi:uncharacterized damage-inducible protein DinB
VSGVRPEAWLRGPVPGVLAALQPAAHALTQVSEELLPLLEALREEDWWARPGDSASIGFHAAHLAGSLDRLATYARGEPLSDAQHKALAWERNLDAARPSPAALRSLVEGALSAALAQLAATAESSLGAPREVGRARLPSTVLGLLSHGAEHTVRHAGQIATLERVLRGPGAR